MHSTSVTLTTFCEDEDETTKSVLLICWWNDIVTIAVVAEVVSNLTKSPQTSIRFAEGVIAESTFALWSRDVAVPAGATPHMWDMRPGCIQQLA